MTIEELEKLMQPAAVNISVVSTAAANTEYVYRSRSVADSLNAPAIHIGADADSNPNPQPPSEPPKGETPKDETPKDETPKDGTPKDETLKGQDPTQTDDGSTVISDGETVTTPSGNKIKVPPGTAITAVGQIIFPKGSGGGTITHVGGNTFNIREGTVIALDESKPLGYSLVSVNPFSDVSEGDWFYDYAMFAFNHGLMLGTSAAEPMMFSPNIATSRGMIVTILHRMDGSPVANGPPNSFNDVAPGAWHSGAVAWAAENSIVSGYGNGLFGPGDNITREQLAVIIANYTKHKGYNLPSVEADAFYNEANAFTDEADVAPWAADAVKMMRSAGIVSGKPGNLFDPSGFATRAEIAAVFTRLLEALQRPELY
jgi:hypothetical protein